MFARFLYETLMQLMIQAKRAQVYKFIALILQIVQRSVITFPHQCLIARTFPLYGTERHFETLHAIWDDKRFKHFFAGGIAGAISRTCVSPLERNKILLQVVHL